MKQMHVAQTKERWVATVWTNQEQENRTHLFELHQNFHWNRIHFVRAIKYNFSLLNDFDEHKQMSKHTERDIGGWLLSCLKTFYAREKKGTFISYFESNLAAVNALEPYSSIQIYKLLITMFTLGTLNEIGAFMSSINATDTRKPVCM